MFRFRSVIVALLIWLPALLVGCGIFGQSGDGSGNGEAVGTSLPFATVTLTPTPIPTRTPTPEPTPIPRVIKVNTQALDADGILVIDSVSLPEDGWLVVYREVDGDIGEVIGQTALAAGIHENISVRVDSSSATETMYAGLHVDGGKSGVFEFPGADEPWPGEPRTRFSAEILLPRPEIVVSDQPVAEDGVVILDHVQLVEPSWVLIHADEAGANGPILGRVLLEPGTYENITLSIPWRQATPTLHAVLYEDEPDLGRLEVPGNDKPILVDGKPVKASFKTDLPPDILIYDQPVIDGSIVVDRVISNGPGWVVVHFDDDGQPGLIIGQAPLVDGLNTEIKISLIESAVTPRLYLRVHEDTEPGDPFDFPREDPPVLYNNRLPPAISMRTDGGAHLIVKDQTVHEDNIVTVQLVVSPVDAWVAVQIDEDGAPGRMIGRTLVRAGLSREVRIPLDPGSQPGNMYIVMYKDLGTPGRFDALGVDPLLTNGSNAVVRLPFVLESASVSN